MRVVEVRVVAIVTACKLRCDWLVLPDHVYLRVTRLLEYFVVIKHGKPELCVFVFASLNGSAPQNGYKGQMCVVFLSSIRSFKVKEKYILREK